MALAIAFPSIDPVLFEIGPFAIRWYALAYVAGLLLGWRYMRRLAEGPPRVASAHQVDDFLLWATLGVVLGGRLGYVLFYRPDLFAGDPLAVLRIWRGGMSFHGGFLGVAAVALIYVRVRRIPALAFGDILGCAAPIGLFLGRLANFVNGELYGRVSDVPWAMVFPLGGPEPRHPSQLYEAFLEGLVLFLLLWVLWRREDIRRRPGMLTGFFIAGYGAMRCFGELFRQPDLHLGFLAAGLTMGQILSIPMILAGGWLILHAARRG
jgi:phosphatidylglycerol---prolipoprotein diacylglyceryl transferase